MRVGIEATSMFIPVKTGIQRYATSLILAIAEALSEHPDLELFLYFHSGDRHADALLLPQYVPKLGHARIRTWHFPRGYRLALPVMAVVDRLDLLHLPAPNMPRFCACPTVVTVHDLCWVRLPPDVVAGERAVSMPIVEKAIRKASAFIAVSQNTRDDLVTEYGVVPDRVWVTAEGVDAQYHPAPEGAENVRRKYGLGKYILYVGTLQRRKNLVRLAEAYAHLLALHRIPHKLILAGPKGWGYEEVYGAVERLGLNGQVMFLGYVPEEDLPGLYTGADLFVYPSLYEGFGLPVLEAMACGVPVAVAKSSSLPEVTGGVGLYFDPLSAHEMAAVMHTALANPELAADLRRRGLMKAQRFTWQETAHKTLAVYRMMAGQCYPHAVTSSERPS